MDAAGNDVSAATFYLPGMLAAGVLLSGLQNLAIDIAMEKSDGTLKRLAGTPLSVISYFIGKIGQVLVTGVLQAALLILRRAVRLRGRRCRPSRRSGSPSPGCSCWASRPAPSSGIGLSGLPRSGKSATAVIIPIVLVLQFISGVYLTFTSLPEWLQNVASVFPLKWLAQGMRSVFLPVDVRVARGRRRPGTSPASRSSPASGWWPG